MPDDGIILKINNVAQSAANDVDADDTQYGDDGLDVIVLYH